MLLKYIDSIYQTEKDSNKKDYSNLNDYISYISITFETKEGENEFVIKKSSKAKIYIHSNNQYIYFSDADIIYTIISFSTEVVQWFFEQFIGLYNGKYETVHININDTSFEGIGIPRYPDNFAFNAFSDTSMHINEFIQMINFIFSKDYQHGKDKLHNPTDKLKETLTRYISIIGAYCLNNKLCIEYLKQINYYSVDRFEKEYFIYNVKKIDKNIFDISKLMC